MANEVELINGVTKREYLGNFEYSFPLAIITVNVQVDSFTVRLKTNYAQPITTTWGQLTEKLGSADAEGYVDKLAEGGYYFNIAPLDSLTSALIPDDQRVNVFSLLPDPVLNSLKYWVVDLLEADNQAGIYKSNGVNWFYVGSEASLLEKSSTPPLDTNKLWWSTTDGLLYTFDVDKWVTTTIFKLPFTRNGNVSNNEWLDFGQVQGNQTDTGVVIAEEIRVLFADWTNKNSVLGQFFLYSGEDGLNAAAIDSFATTTATLGRSSPTGGVFDLPAIRRVSILWQGISSNDANFILNYRKIWV